MRKTDKEFLMEDFDFSKARRITPREVRENRKAIEAKVGVKRPVRSGRPAKPSEEKFKPISIRLAPNVLKWAKKEAKKKGTGYQTFINQVLQKLAG